MKKEDLISLLNEIFIPLGFKRKGNNWLRNDIELSKIINLQKSNYSNSFYINYGYIINKIELTTFTHVGNRLGSADANEQKRITDLLNLEIENEKRIAELKKIIFEKIAFPIQSINTEEDLLKELKKRQHLNDIPLTVKRHFNFPLPSNSAR